MVRSILASVVVGVFAVCVAAGGANAQNFVTDISENVIAINSSFTGQKLVLFGAIDRTAESLISDDNIQGELNIVVVIRGPKRPLVVRQKSRVAGVWANTRSQVIIGAPSYYYVSSYKVYEDEAYKRLFKQNEIGAQNLRMQAEGGEISPEDLEAFRQAVIRQKKKDKLYFEEFGSITLLDETLFRTEITIPAHVPVGAYATEVFLLRGANILSVQSKPFYINKTGIGRSVYEFAYDHPFFYGLGAVLIALLAGWAASMVFRRD